MENFSEHIVAYGVWTVVVIAFIFLLRAANIIRYIPNNQVGIVEKLWATRGSIKSGFIALHARRGFSRKSSAAASISSFLSPIANSC